MPYWLDKHSKIDIFDNLYQNCANGIDSLCTSVIVWIDEREIQLQTKYNSHWFIEQNRVSDYAVANTNE